MKQIYLSLIGAMMAITATAQNQMLSSYTVDPTTDEKTWSYKATYENGLLVKGYDTYYYSDGTEMECKALYYYDSQGKLQKSENYDRVDGEWVISRMVELIEPDAEGHEVWVTWTTGEDNPGHLVPYMKHVILSYCNNDAMDYDAYLPDGDGGWVFYGTARGEKNSQGLLASQVITVYWSDGEHISTMTYEYDSHNKLTRETYATDVFSAYDTTYENFYDADGNLEKRNVYDSGEWTSIQYYTWGERTAIQSVKDSAAASAPWFDLNGRRLESQPTKKGLFIRNGKKVLIKYK